MTFTDDLGLRLVCFARGVAVFEMPVGRQACDGTGRVENGVLTALAEAAMTAAARTGFAEEHDGSDSIVPHGLTAGFTRPVHAGEAARLRAEAIVMWRRDETVHVEADVLCGEERVATFAADCAPAFAHQAAA